MLKAPHIFSRSAKSSKFKIKVVADIVALLMDQLDLPYVRLRLAHYLWI